MPWYLITDSRGSPFEYLLSAELDPEGIMARPGSALETHRIGHKNRAKCQVAPDPFTAATSRAPYPRWPASPPVAQAGGGEGIWLSIS